MYICLRQYEELRRSKDGIGYGTEAGFFDVVGEQKIIKLFQSVSIFMEKNNPIYLKLNFDTIGLY
jgi:hypothetical protein